MTGFAALVATACSADLDAVSKQHDKTEHVQRRTAAASLLARGQLFATPMPVRDWEVRPRAGRPGIEGFADAADVTPGRVVTLYVTTTAPTFTVEAFRMGWYGDTAAALIWRSDPVVGQRQARPALIEPTRTIYAPWTPSVDVPTTGWPTGDYLLRLQTPQGSQRFVPLTIRNRSLRGRVVVLNEVATWQAYNAWGGYSLYHGPHFNEHRRSYAVSFDRPYDRGAGAGDFIRHELAAVEFLSRLKLRLGWVTSLDIARDPRLLVGARAVVSLGHDEYYSSLMREALRAARDSGTNLAFLGGNDIYRHVRFARSPLGPDRVEIDYKQRGLDPIERTNPAEDTVSWADNRPSRPESQLLGEMFTCIDKSPAPMVVADPKSWLTTGLHLYPGESFPDLVGPEGDGVDPYYPTPRPIDVLFHSPARCGSRSAFVDASYYSASSGAGVFDAGTQQWQCALAGGVGTGACPVGTDDPLGDHIVQEITTRLMQAFAAGPAGLVHPARDDVAGLRLPDLSHPERGNPLT